jgi:ribosomal protein L17
MSSLKVYVDGCNNRWILGSDSIEYKAMTESMSSSGFYSGGVDRTIPWSKDQQTVLDKLVEKAINDSASHSDQRQMGTSLLQFGDKFIMLKMRSQAKADLDSFFESLK